MPMCGMANAFAKAFGTDPGVFETIALDNRNGFDIICRPSQFGRFMVYRMEIGTGINGMKDLNPQVFTPEDAIGRIARSSGVCREHVEKVLGVISVGGVSFDDLCLDDAKGPDGTCGRGITVDVSDNFTHNHRSGQAKVCFVYEAESGRRRY